MATTAESRTPVHLWIVGILSLLWSCFGSYDYTMTRMRNLDYVAQSMPGVDPNAALAWVDNMPLLVQIGWGLGVWLGLAGSVLLLIRNRWAVWAFGISMVGAIVSLGWQIAMAPPLAGATGAMFKVMPYVIIVITVALFLYARAMAAKGVLR
ncbi:MAG: hypothetical protein JOZ20_04390 [Sphingomonas sp.]|nr:hypothetical protein [Sphingomonas sp.]MBW0006767.1 hypothetical protein [Sphingomonas sp.]